MSASASMQVSLPARPRPQDTDRHVGARLRERRLQLGMTQQRMAELIGVTYQQAHKYEKGTNRIAGGRLYAIARALGVEVSFFYEGMDAEAHAFEPNPKQRLLLELTRNFASITNRRQQEAVCDLARALASFEVHGKAEPESAAAVEIGSPATVA